jgi:F0F1-type ATP synthase membrane subunit b/b'
MFNEAFWYTVAFVTFICIIIDPMKTFLKSLDAQIDDIKKDIEESETMKTTSSILFEKEKSRMDNIDSEVKKTKEEVAGKIAEVMIENSKDLEDSLKKKFEEAEKKIEFLRKNGLISKNYNFLNIVYEVVYKYLEKDKSIIPSDMDYVKNIANIK